MLLVKMTAWSHEAWHLRVWVTWEKLWGEWWLIWPVYWLTFNWYRMMYEMSPWSDPTEFVLSSKDNCNKQHTGPMLGKQSWILITTSWPITRKEGEQMCKIQLLIQKHSGTRMPSSNHIQSQKTLHSVLLHCRMVCLKSRLYNVKCKCNPNTWAT